MVLLVAILLAPATRIGYLLYPLNFFVWSWMLTGESATSADAALDPSAHSEGDSESIAVTHDQINITVPIYIRQCGDAVGANVDGVEVCHRRSP